MDRDMQKPSGGATLARGLGWFSIALGVAQLVAPRAMSRTAGVSARTALVRAYGLREIACGVGLLAARDLRPFLAARVAGDIADMGSLAAASFTLSPRAKRSALGAAVNIVGIAALDLFATRVYRDARTRERTRRAACHDYSERTGFPSSAAQMRGAALADFQIPRDLRAPKALQPYTRAEDDTPKPERVRAGSVG
ncbi:hypothetical protein OKW49_003722 [Paraburkholderia youngii]